jgi:hypothetical protein
MFSCRQATRRTLELLERRLSAPERMARWGHLLICRHCRAHARQIHGLLFVLNRQDPITDFSVPRLSPAAHARIVAAVRDANSG